MALKIVCIGDSITGENDLERYNKWSNLLQLLLEGRSGLGNAEVQNWGVGGNTSADLLERLDFCVAESKPDIAVLLVGGNDRHKPLGITPEMTRRNLDRIVDRIQSACSKILMLEYHVLPFPEHPETAWTHLAKSNPIIEVVARERSIPTLHMGDVMAQASKRYPLAELVNPEDSVHLRPAGEIAYAKAIYRKLEDLIWI